MNHQLEMSRIDPATASKARRKLIADGADLHEAHCTCGEWKIPLALPSEIGNLFTEHVLTARGYRSEESCDHCHAILLPKPKPREPVLCIDCVTVCTDDCDHRWNDEG